MAKQYIVFADSGRLFKLEQHSSEWEWSVFDDGKFELYELQMDVMHGNSRLKEPKVGANLVATFPGENRLSQGRILEVYKA
ncbi:hypothetical protein HY488_00015 [Candidatus Woesearchaeota archaeon]|nr:hypothetical protein [Candidatus Woesearchaeota archaeon]